MSKTNRATGDKVTLTDEGNARRFASQHGGDVRFTSALGWLRWDGMRWAHVDDLQVVELAKTTARSFYREAARMKDEASQQRYASHARYSSSKRGLEAMVSLARSEPLLSVSVDQLDADPWLLNCQNGTLDLITGKLRPHDRADLITKLAGAAFDPEATSEVFDRFRERIFVGNPDLESFVQRACGYSLTGTAREEVFFVGFGGPATGKSTLLEAMAAAMGDYAEVTPIATFLRRRNPGEPRNDIARLAGARLVTTSEVPPGQYFDEALVKQMTGGDSIAARFLHKEFFAFVPRFKVWMVGNHRPRVRDDDPALWRRLLAIPFVAEIPKAEQNPRVKEHLRDPATGGAAVLAWAVEGCLAWQQLGLGVPAAVRDLTTEYRQEMDTFGRFLEDRAVLAPVEWSSWSDIVSAYGDWCVENGNRYPLGESGLRERLRGRGFALSKRNGARGWSGLRVAIGASPFGGVDSKDTLDSDSGKSPIQQHMEKFPEKVSNTVPLSTESDDDQVIWPEIVC